jgi:alpha-glucosidase (family GH31 glycosyl hydrolase)
LEEGVVERSVYLPEGNWIDYWTEKIHAGPRLITSQASLDTIPLFIRAGAIIPMGPLMEYSSQRALDPLFLEIYRGANRTLTLYEDDDETTAYYNGEYSKSSFEVIDNESEFICHLREMTGSFNGRAGERTIILNVHQQPWVTEVTEGTEPLPRATTPEAMAEAEVGWFWNERSRVLSIKLLPCKIARTVRVR